MSHDNQGRDLKAVKRHFDTMARLHNEGEELSHQKFLEVVAKFPLADWTDVEGVLVLRAGESRYVAVPKNGKKTAANFEIVDLDARELVTVLKKDEVYSWLWRASQEQG